MRRTTMLVTLVAVASCGGAKLRGWNGTAIDALAAENSRIAAAIAARAIVVEEVLLENLTGPSEAREPGPEIRTAVRAIAKIQQLATAINVYSADQRARASLVVEDAGWRPEEGALELGSPLDDQMFNRLAGDVNAKVERRRWLNSLPKVVANYIVERLREVLPWWVWVLAAAGVVFFLFGGREWLVARRRGREREDIRAGLRQMVKVARDAKLDVEMLNERTRNTPAVKSEFHAMRDGGLL